MALMAAAKVGSVVAEAVRRPLLAIHDATSKRKLTPECRQAVLLPWPRLAARCRQVGLGARLARLWISVLALGLSACGGGATSGSSVAPVLIASQTASRPAAPINLLAVPADAAVILYFSAGNADPDAQPTGYVTSCVGGGGAKVDAQSSGSPVVVAGLLNGTTYVCSVLASNAVGSSPAVLVTATPGASPTTGAFRGNLVLGSPTDKSILLNVYAADQSGRVWVVYGRNAGTYEAQTVPVSLVAGQPLEIAIGPLLADARYYYRLYFQGAGANTFGPTDEYAFHTARPPGQSFTFAIQGDSHPERLKTQFDPDLYTRTLLTAAADRPDFYVLMGDDFSVDTLDPATINVAKVTERYTLQRPYLGLIGRSAPLFLVNGNHEQAARYLLDGTANNVAVWAQNARNAHYSQPAPDDFYSGNPELVPHIGLLRNHFSWTWGDALFVMIDPYWASPVAVDNLFGGADKRSGSLWDITHGDAQYQWLKRTLEQSRAKHKFVFAHHVMGTGRGGVELASQWEWGGQNAKGLFEFTTQRPSWPRPIHQLMVDNHVKIFFQGHDHIWVQQQLDGMVYQTLSEPADPNYTFWNGDAYLTGVKYPNSGYTRVSVSPNGVRVEYVRSYLQRDEGPGKVHGAVVYGYTIP